MNSNDILQLFLTVFPALIVAGIAYYFFKEHSQNEKNHRRYLLQKDLQKEALPLRLQAYERMALFLERISPNKLIVRIQPISSNKDDYENLLVASIEQEFQHNLAQQIYISDKCWDIISAAKNTTIQLIRKANMQEKVDSADKLREVILNALIDKQAPSSAALAFIKDELGNIW